MRLMTKDLPIAQEEKEEDVEQTARLHELLHEPSRRGSGRGLMGRSLRGFREQVSEGQEKIGHRAAAAAGRTSGYVREHRAGEVMHDVQGYVRKHPVQAIGGAVVTGVVIGRLLK
jgi:ElaB/YqjD/DUF883 family membrane-anchored ribosome-binding protein